MDIIWLFLCYISTFFCFTNLLNYLTFSITLKSFSLQVFHVSVYEFQIQF